MAVDDPVTWTQGTEGCWRLGVLDPSPHLAGYVRALTCYHERWPNAVSRRQAATSGAVIFVTWGAPLEVSIGGSSSSFRGFVAGVQDQSASTGHSGAQAGIGVHLSALGVSALLGAPGVELANRCVALDEVLGRSAESLVERLPGATPRGRLALVEAMLAGRLGSAPRLSAEVVWAWRALQARPSAHVADLAAEIGWSRTRLASRFTKQVGISPKRFARVVRFEVARRLLVEGSSSLAEVAYRAGYYDQSHLCRDISALAGCTPSVLASELSSGAPRDP
jgi:AraC-like DNA-binding protein